MKLSDFIRGKTVTLCFLFLGLLLFGITFLFAGIPAELLLLLALFYFIVVSGWLAAGFLIERNRLQQLERQIAELPEKYLLGELLSAPKNFSEFQYFNIVKAISRSAIGAVEQAEKEKEEYCDYVEQWIHEIKTPLTACSLILANHGDIRKLKTELKRADNLTECILYYARLRTVNKDMQLKQFHMSEVVEESIQSQMELLIAAKISVETNGDFEAASDPKALCFILKQLLINCAKYCPGCHIRITAADGCITVEDNGIGIPAHELLRVTERGFTGGSGRKSNNSTGMGLYIVGQLCTQLDIRFDIQSVPGEFTRISLAFASLTNL